MTQQSLLVIGCGYLGRRVAERWKTAGGDVFATTRSSSTAEAFQDGGWSPVLIDLAKPEGSLPQVDHVLWAVGFDRSAGTDRRLVWIDGLQWALSQLTGVKSFGYVSSTSVYGDVDSEIVDENTPLRPLTEGAKCCAEAEAIVHEWGRENNVRTHVLRMAGIYGPDRLLRRIGDLQQQTPIAGEPDHWLNLIHVDDGAAMAEHALKSATTPECINVVNSETATRRTYYSKLAELTDSPAPVFGDSTSAGASGRARGPNKRVTSVFRNAYPALQFDDVLDGLKDALKRSSA